ncbi:hypothetical protein GCM10011316_20820 [Roseibium aquae]|uniref:Uncharacterized protein n=1 Tax=Roseibium aquae TaxID=1323746 RepID=A0A916TKA9_9HYPH|nr:hypothetical protein [Roseibium aquae]GGB48521.1 hypothetical protein GCM10011316_20820 [Roseibium aquae]
MNFCVYKDTGDEIHGYFVPDGFSTKPIVSVRLNEDNQVSEIPCWIYVEGAKAQGLHDTGNVGFVLSDENVPGLSLAHNLEVSDPHTGLVFYRRAQPGQYIPRKILRLETAYVPNSEIDISLKPFFQFFDHKIEHHGFETIRQMLEILHQPSVYVSGRILLKNFRVYIDYNIDNTMISLRDPFYELAMRLFVFSRYNKYKFQFVAPRDRVLFQPVMDWFENLSFEDEQVVTRVIRNAPKDILTKLASPFTQQLVATNPNDPPELDQVTLALDLLSQFTIFDDGQEDGLYARKIETFLDLPHGTVQQKGRLEPVDQLATILRRIDRVHHLLEADLVLHHFIEKAAKRAS